VFSIELSLLLQNSYHFLENVAISRIHFTSSMWGGGLRGLKPPPPPGKVEKNDKKF